jgi:translation initiation factor 1
MSGQRKSKISTDGGGTLGTNPFGALDATKLPQGQPPVSKSSNELKGKKASLSKGRVEIRREKSGRGGKTVTTLREFPTSIPITTLDAMALDLKKSCACGGTLKGRVIELQGDVRNQVAKELYKRGYQPVRAGG